MAPPKITITGRGRQAFSSVTSSLAFLAAPPVAPASSLIKPYARKLEIRLGSIWSALLWAKKLR
jgi:hypothetical protein